jgi:hypothetical protein
MHSSRSWLTMRDVGLGFLLFCSVVYLLAALRGLFPATRELALVGSLLVLIAMVSVRAVIQLRVAPARLARTGALCLFLSFLAWEAPIDGFLIVVVSLLCLALSIGCYLGSSLRELSLKDTPAASRQFTRPVIAALAALAGLTVLFLLMREWFGWFLAMRWMLLVPAALVVYELRHKGPAKQGELLVIRPFLKQDWVYMAAYGFLFAGSILLLLNLVSSFILGLQGQHALQVALAGVFFVMIFVLRPLAGRYCYYLLSLACILLMVVSAVLYADLNPMPGVWFVFSALVGLAVGAAVISLKKACANRDGMGCMRLAYVSVIVALLVIAAYPLCHYAWGAGSFLLVPGALLVALMLSFFTGHD